ncbi:hypothetical protein CMEL01_12599 [Colletotrichum melonis]|uniref:Modin n=1 Tax=Colletotrichum melonis TaxID=1209925 RepID=A0AAI9USD3_9PEZI|nr:hypothetical protein CMEL01_12599 [Colletotrichum melonis]
MIATLLAGVAISSALIALILSISTSFLCTAISTFFLCTARKRGRPATSRFKGIIGSPETDTESPIIRVGLEAEAADLMDGSLVLNIDGDPTTNNRDAQAASAGLFDESATWAKLLDECRKMESESQNWEKLSWRVQHGTSQPDIQGNAALTVGVQRNGGKPPSIKGSKTTQNIFAITSMRHLIELVAFLGLHWIEFDSQRRCCANGNGFFLEGVREVGIGFVFQLHKVGSSLPAKRVIPAVDIRELCFGAIPTFYRAFELDETYSFPLDTPRSLETLRLGTRDKVTKTLYTIGCNNRSIRAYIEAKNSMLLFSVVFEIIGMFARILHIKDRCFTYIPNPTGSQWNEHRLSLRCLLSSFCSLILEEEAQPLRTGGIVSQELCRIAFRLDKVLPQGRGHSLGPMHQNELHLALDELDITLKTYHKTLVLDVLRSHLEEILQAGVRLDGEATDEQDLFSDLGFASRDELERGFMERYFHVIRHLVVAREPRNSKLSSVMIERNDVCLLTRLIAHVLKSVFEQATDLKSITVEVERNAEDHWSAEVARRARWFASFPSCTSGYLTGEGLVQDQRGLTKEMKDQISKQSSWGEGILSFQKVVEAWMNDGKLDGLIDLSQSNLSLQLFLATTSNISLGDA